jgi:hypothetical protein
MGTFKDDTSFEYERFEDGQHKNKYDDRRMRQIAIEFFKKVFGLEFKSGDEKGIDLVLISDPNVGAEGEDGSWNGDYWVSGLSLALKTGIRTLNIPHRKWKYWNLQEYSVKKEAKWSWGKINLGWNKNFYFRINRQCDQIIVIEAETILDNEKRIINLNIKVGNKSVPEDWFSFTKENSRTFNLQPDGEWIENGKYCGLSKKECDEIWFEEQRLKREKEKRRAVEIFLKNK